MELSDQRLRIDELSASSSSSSRTTDPDNVTEYAGERINNTGRNVVFWFFILLWKFEVLKIFFAFNLS